MRTLVFIGIILSACLANYKFSEHHTGSNVFETLYLHLMPAKLVKNNHDHDAADYGEPLVKIGLPSALSAIGISDGDHGDDHGDGHGDDGHGEDSHADDAHGEEGRAAAGHAGAEDHGDDEHGAGAYTTIFNLQLFQVAAVLMVLVGFSGVPSYLRTGKGDGISKLFAGFCMYIRDEMVYPVMGAKTGARFLPYFLALFFFLLFMNMMGLLPFSATATASVFVTAGMALTTLFMMLFYGMKDQGIVAFWKNLVPHVPGWLWPLMLVVEVVGLCVKPFALMIRLFANMSGGHMVVLSFMGLIFFFAGNMGSAVGWASSPVAVGFAVFIMIIEGFVAMLQAYIFTQLSILFIHSSIHPEH